MCVCVCVCVHACIGLCTRGRCRSPIHVCMYVYLIHICIQFLCVVYSTMLKCAFIAYIKCMHISRSFYSPLLNTLEPVSGGHCVRQPPL